MDLSVLPNFQQNANLPQANGFYTGTPEWWDACGAQLTRQQSSNSDWNWTVPRFEEF